MTKYLFTLQLFILLLCSFSFSSTLDAQEWIKTFDFDKVDEAYEVFEAPDSGYLVVAMSKPEFFSVSDSNKLRIIKTDINGNEEWIKSIDEISLGAVATMTKDNHLAYTAVHIDWEMLPSGDYFGNSLLIVEKIDMDGNVVWTLTEDEVTQDTSFKGERVNVFDILPTNDGGVLIVGDIVYTNSFFTGGRESPRSLYLIRLDANGNVLWKKYDPMQVDRQYDIPGSIIETPDGGFLMTYGPGIDSVQYNIIRNTSLIKLDSLGDIVWNKDYDQIVYNSTSLFFNTTLDTRHGFHDLKLTADGHIVVCGIATVLNSVFFDDILFMAELDEDGNVLKTKVPGMYYIQSMSNRRLMEMQKDENGGYLIIMGESTKGRYNTTGQVPYRLVEISLLKVDAQLNTVWIKRFGDDYPLLEEFHVGASVKRTSDEHYIIAGRKFVQDNNNTSISIDIYLIKTDTLPQFPILIEGTVSREQLNNDCLPDANMPGLQNNIIQVEGDFIYSGITDTSGHYYLHVSDTGQYIATLTTPNALWEACDSIKNIHITNYANVVTNDYLINSPILCPYLHVDITTPILRQCTDSSYYYVQYCNMGTAAAVDSRIEVELSPEMEYISTNGPLPSQQANLLTFDLGDLAIGECGQFRINIFIPCGTELRRTHCVEARIFPDTICEPVNSLWDGSSLFLSGYCEGDSVTFQIENLGNNNMSQPSNYIVIEDEIMRDENSIQLLSGGIETIKYAANGHTLRMEVEQVIGHPRQSQPSVAIEGCGVGPFNFGNILPFGQDDGNPTVSIDCRQVRNAYDPNDKQGFPLGLGERHFIKPGTDLEYLIRFQNVGNDTAFNIIILDTLSPHLNVLSLEMGASSHPYQLGFAGENVLKFTFDNIQLPDSASNEAASQGFVKFRIDQQDNLPIGTTIYNSAAIYFDYLDPVITNKTYHEINDNFLQVAVINPAFAKKNVQIAVSPNPFTVQTTFRMENTQELKTLVFQLYDVAGRPVLHKDISGQSEFELQRNALASGVYFYEVTSQGRRVGTGKLLIQ